MTASLIERTLVQFINAAFPVSERFAPPEPLGGAAWPPLVDAAQRHGLGPLLFAALKKNAWLAQLPADVAARLQTMYYRTRVGNLLTFQELGRCLEGFQREQIPVALLKGSALIAQLYPDPGMRPLGDVDLLIPYEAATRAQTLLVGRGYEPHIEVANEFGHRFSNERSFLLKGKRSECIDLHWHLFGLPYYRQRTSIDWFWQRTTTIDLAGQPARVFTPTAQLLYLSAHSALHHGGRRLLWLYDIALLLARCRDEIAWEELVQSAQEFGLVRPLKMTLSQVQAVWGVSMPAGVKRRLDVVRPTLQERYVFAVTTAQRPDLRLLVDGLSLPGPQAKLGYWRRQVFPEPGWMKARYQIADLRLLPFFYIWRMIKGIYAISRSAISVATAKR